MAMERANLLNMAKLSIKGLIESALSFGRTLDSDYPPLQQFFVVMEHCLKHGLKGTAVSTKHLHLPVWCTGQFSQYGLSLTVDRSLQLIGIPKDKSFAKNDICPYLFLTLNIVQDMSDACF